MKELTKAEEQIMQVLWNLEKGFLKDIHEALPEPRPAYTTVSTVVRVLVKKGFIDFNTYGKVNEYFPKQSKDSYFQGKFKGLVGSYFNHSISGFTSFFAKDESLDLDDLEELKSILQAEIEKRKGDQE